MSLKNVNWFNTIFLFLFHIVGGYFVVRYFVKYGVDLRLVGLGVVFYLLTGLSITAGYHRLLSHRSYEAHPVLELFYLLFGAAAFENSALNWCYDHRVHHRYVDKEDDPYNINNGFWYAHMGWILTEKKTKKDFPQYKRDLQKNKLVVWQNKYYITIAVLMSFVLPALIGGLFGKAMGAFLIAGLGRIIIVHHATFFINSLCHIWGKQTYTDENTAKDNFILALFTYGEGFHNFHHLFHKDYRNGIKWFHFDPTKWLIKSASYVGLAKKLTVTPKRKILLAKMTMKQKLIECKQYDKAVWLDKLEPMMLKVDQKFTHWMVLKEEYKEQYELFKKEKTYLAMLKLEELKNDLYEAKLGYKAAYKNWKGYSRLLLRANYA